MKIQYNVTGDERKRLVKSIAELTGSEPRYLGAPSFAYEAGGFTIGKDGTVSFDNAEDCDLVQRVMDGLSERGFRFEETDSFTIELSRERLSDATIENLRKLVVGKAALIQKALGADSLDIEVTDERVRFPWFRRQPEAEVIYAFATLAGCLAAQATALRRVNTTSKVIENEKYAFRVFLLRLGMIGDDYKAVRKTLLKNLSGNSAFRNGSPVREEAEGNE